MSDFANFMELAEKRYSVRKYSDREIEQEKLDRILHAGLVAPTAANRVPQRVFVLKSDEAMQKARTVTRYCFNAPMALLICYDVQKSWKAADGHDSGHVDAAIAITQMMLEAFEEGIGSCWVRGFNRNDVIKVFELPDNLEPVALLPIGYPAEDSKPYPGAHEKRIPIEEMVKYI